ncbi:lipopolysaccharide biosynthesis protein [Vibrio cyclitrophicus]
MTRSILKNSSIYVFGNLINAAIPFMLLPILVRFLTQEEYGQIAMYQVFVSIFCIIVPLGMQSASSRKYFDKSKDDYNEYSNYIVNASLVPVIAFAILTAFSTYFNQELQNIGLRETWIWLSLLTGLAFYFCQLRLSQWQIRGNAKRFVIFQVSLSSLIFILTLVFLIFSSSKVDGRPFGQFLAFSVFSLLAIYSLKIDGLFSLKKFQILNILDSLKIGIPMAIHSLGSMAIIFIDRYIISTKLSLSDVAIYAVAYQLSSIFMIFFDSINRALAPKLFEILSSDDNSERVKVVKFSYLILFSLCFLALLVCFAYPKLIPFIIGEQYHISSELLSILCLGQFFVGGYFVFANYIFYSKKTSYIAFITIFSLLVTALLMWLWVGKYQLLGIAFAFFCGQALRFVLSIFFAIRLESMPWLYFKINNESFFSSGNKK